MCVCVCVACVCLDVSLSTFFSICMSLYAKALIRRSFVQRERFDAAQAPKRLSAREQEAQWMREMDIAGLQGGPSIEAAASDDDSDMIRGRPVRAEDRKCALLS
jgi:hypothetical protein